MEFPRSQQGYGYARGFGHRRIAAPFDNAGCSIPLCSSAAASASTRQFIRWENASCNVIYLKRGGLEPAALTHQFGEPSDKED
jgi:hypothetical protein